MLKLQLIDLDFNQSLTQSSYCQELYTQNLFLPFTDTMNIRYLISTRIHDGDPSEISSNSRIPIRNCPVHKDEIYSKRELGFSICVTFCHITNAP